MAQSIEFKVDRNQVQASVNGVWIGFYKRYTENNNKYFVLTFYRGESVVKDTEQEARDYIEETFNNFNSKVNE
jgi:hypothetical protein